MPKGEPRVWVGCLGCYNAGALVGAWVDADVADELEPHDALPSEPSEAWGPYTRGRPPCGRPEGADERWCLDHEGFGGLLEGECSPAEAARVAGIMAAIEADGYAVEAVAAWLEATGAKLGETWAETAEAFSDSFCGEAESGPAYAEQLAEELGAFSIGAGEPYGGDPVDVSARWPFSCIDWGRAWHELELGDGYRAVENPAGGVWVIRAW